MMSQGFYDDVIKWEHFLRYWSFGGEIHGSPMKSPSQSPVRRSFDVFFDVRLNKRLSKQSWGWWFETPSRPLWRRGNVTWIQWDSISRALGACLEFRIVYTYNHAHMTISGSHYIWCTCYKGNKEKKIIVHAPNCCILCRITYGPHNSEVIDAGKSNIWALFALCYGLVLVYLPLILRVTSLPLGEITCLPQLGWHSSGEYGQKSTWLHKELRFNQTDTDHNKYMCSLGSTIFRVPSILLYKAHPIPIHWCFSSRLAGVLQAMLQLHLNYQQFCCLLRCDLY